MFPSASGYQEPHQETRVHSRDWPSQKATTAFGKILVVTSISELVCMCVSVCRLVYLCSNTYNVLVFVEWSVIELLKTLDSWKHLWTILSHSLAHSTLHEVPYHV